jgi:hypothetical protein
MVEAWSKTIGSTASGSHMAGEITEHHKFVFENFITSVICFEIFAGWIGISVALGLLHYRTSNINTTLLHAVL